MADKKSILEKISSRLNNMKDKANSTGFFSKKLRSNPLNNFPIANPTIINTRTPANPKLKYASAVVENPQPLPVYRTVSIQL